MDTTSAEDLCIWPDGTTCLAEDLAYMLQTHSDDFQRIPYGTPAWDEAAAEHGYEEDD